MINRLMLARQVALSAKTYYEQTHKERIEGYVISLTEESTDFISKSLKISKNEVERYFQFITDYYSAGWGVEVITFTGK